MAPTEPLMQKVLQTSTATAEHLCEQLSVELLWPACHLSWSLLGVL